MNNARYYPSTLNAKLGWMTNFNARLQVSPSPYGLTAGDAGDVLAVVGPLAAAFALAAAPTTGTPVTRAARDSALRAAELVCLPLATTVARNKSVAPDDKIDLGVTVPSTVKTIVPTPTAKPVVSVDSQSGVVATLRYTNSETPGRWAAPLGCTVELFYVVGTVAAVDPEQIKYQGKRTKSPYTIETTAADAGKVVSVTMRFTKRSGTAGEDASGPFADIVTYIAGNASA